MQAREVIGRPSPIVDRLFDAGVGRWLGTLAR